VRLYTRDPLLSDVTTDRGGFSGGRRVDQVTYAFEEPGAYTLPAIDIGWFDAATGKRRSRGQRRINVSVAQVPVAPTDMAPPAPPGDAPAEPGTHTLWQPALVGWRRLGPRLWAWRQVRRQAWAGIRARVIFRLKRACLAGDAATAYREFWI
jgi:hypothetical protein